MGDGTVSADGLAWLRRSNYRPKNFRGLMLFVYEKETYDGVHWTEEVLYKHVPRTFETAIVDQDSARYALNHAIGRNFRRHIPG